MTKLKDHLFVARVKDWKYLEEHLTHADYYLEHYIAKHVKPLCGLDVRILEVHDNEYYTCAHTYGDLNGASYLRAEWLDLGIRFEE